MNMWVWKSDPRIKNMNSYLYAYTVNVSITTVNFLTTNYCQVMSFSQKIYVCLFLKS